MSFSINGPDNNFSSVQKSHHANDGGAGNLGYFNQEKKKKKDKESEVDSFESSTQEDKSELLLEELDTIGTRIKMFWRILRSSFRETKDSEQEQKNPEE